MESGAFFAIGFLSTQIQKHKAQWAVAVEYTTASLKRGKIHPTGVLDMTLNNTGAVGNAEYLFTAIAPRSTLARSGST